MMGCEGSWPKKNSFQNHMQSFRKAGFEMNRQLELYVRSAPWNRRMPVVARVWDARRDRRLSMEGTRSRERNGRFIVPTCQEPCTRRLRCTEQTSIKNFSCVCVCVLWMGCFGKWCVCRRICRRFGFDWSVHHTEMSNFNYEIEMTDRQTGFGNLSV